MVDLKRPCFPESNGGLFVSLELEEVSFLVKF